AELVVLPQPSFLRPLIAEDRADVINLPPRALIVEQPVLDHRPHDAGRAFGAKRKRAVLSIRKRVRLLADDIRRLADPAVKQLAMLENRDADLFEVIQLGGLARDALDGLPLWSIRREDVNHALRRGDAIVHRGKAQGARGKRILSPLAPCPSPLLSFFRALLFRRAL